MMAAFNERPSFRGMAEGILAKGIEHLSSPTEWRTSGSPGPAGTPSRTPIPVCASTPGHLAGIRAHSSTRRPGVRLREWHAGQSGASLDTGPHPSHRYALPALRRCQPLPSLGRYLDYRVTDRGPSDTPGLYPLDLLRALGLLRPLDHAIPFPSGPGPKPRNGAPSSAPGVASGMDAVPLGAAEAPTECHARHAVGREVEAPVRTGAFKCEELCGWTVQQFLR